LFDRGSFAATTLWSCSIIEKIMDNLAEEIISKEPLKKGLFKKENGYSLFYPTQLENIKFVFNSMKLRNHEKIKTQELWQNIRNKIAHENYKPTFEETYYAMSLLAFFITDMPEILKKSNL
jgi:hypothetical protein